ncbi:GGDEF domain-containing protein [Peteryoungia desertarenae]|uniref:diguanylate cyclase n=1 Tax=Peteryoungia desertarenae TaxID=1813451 RepID=A0ABX6QQX9_9HYPH|nr:GGDEF domain-containing protein [Peteryoungia desertarenae]QLF70842.1 GGDEF domain-containing protein [Peteryoungia desertarenae]
MVGFIKNWLISQLTLGEFASRQAVFYRSFGMAARIAMFAYSLNLISHLVLYAFDLLPYELGPGLVMATVLTPPVSLVVGFVAYAVVGLAVYDLGVSRREFERLSRTDMLSGLSNRRAFLESFDRARGEVGMLLFDIDRFKVINDSHGHQAGDDVIAAVAATITRRCGSKALCARIGGEEFAALIVAPAQGELLSLAEQIVADVRVLPIDVADRRLQVTISCGAVTAPAEIGFAEIFAAADRALYLAKAEGRDRIVCANSLIQVAKRMSVGLSDLAVAETSTRKRSAS